MSNTRVTANFEFSIIVNIFAASLILNYLQNVYIRTSKGSSFYEMVEAIKKVKFLSELPKEEIEMGEADITDNALASNDGENLRLINQIASDMVKRSDVD